MLTITSVRTPSPASAAGFRRSDSLLSCNGLPLEDWLDFLYDAGGTVIELKYRRGGVERRKTLRRVPGVEWGFTFKGQEPRPCRRKCVFCFVDQLPPGVRSSLLVKDDDIRYSFLYGTYVTLHSGDVEYAIAKQLSPIHVSVHATEPDLRGRMLGTGREEPVMEDLLTLSAAEIEMETQIVVVPGYNDEEHLQRTVRDLFSVPMVKSVGVVPAGITRFREGLPGIRRPSPEESGRIVDLCGEWRTRAIRAGRGGWIFPSDELFILAGVDIPGSGYYEGCTLRENGIGMLASLRSVERREYRGSGVVCTGELAAPFIERLLENSDYLVEPIENRFLGRQVGAAGLLSGADVVRTVGELNGSYNRVILPSVMFNHDMLTIDDRSPRDLSRLTGRSILVLDDLEGLE